MQGRDGSLSFFTLVIASVSSAAAALLTSLFWESGTVFSAAFTPVIVSIVSEALKKPATTISQVRTARRQRVSSTRAEGAGAEGRGAAGTANGAGSDTGRGGTATVVRSEPAPGGGSPRRGPKVLGRRINMRLALATGALAFVIAAAFLTLPELLVGQSIAGQPGRTTLGGGSSVDRSGEGADPAAGGEESGDPASQGGDPEAEPTPEDPATAPDTGASGAPEEPSGDPASPEPQQQQRTAPGQEGSGAAPSEPQQSQPAEPAQP